MTTFALVHGAFHDARCWERLTPLLEEAGHGVVAMDLPIEDNSATFDTYADVVCASLDDCSDDLILVGHSYAGSVIPLVAARRPVRHLVYVCAYVPDLGKSLADQLGDEPELLNTECYRGLKTDAEFRTEWCDLGLAQALMYADCDEPTVQTAIARLRPQSVSAYELPTSLAEFPSVSCTFIACSEDQLIPAACAGRIARDRLGADVIELPGSHSPFLSRPSALADVLLRIADGSSNRAASTNP
jgi:pimeloyl-ACP methyl ester carboxylesterase